MPGRRQKPTSELTDQRWQRTLGRDVELAGPSEIIAPAPERGWLKATKLAWSEFWSGPMAAHITINHHVHVRWYFRCLDEAERCYRAYRRERVTPGHAGQPRRSPLADLAFKWLDEAKQYAERFGATPRDSVRFGGELATGLADAIDRINASLDVGAEGDEDAGEWIES